MRKALLKTKTVLAVATIGALMGCSEDAARDSANPTDSGAVKTEVSKLECAKLTPELLNDDLKYLLFGSFTPIENQARENECGWEINGPNGELSGPISGSVLIGVWQQGQGPIPTGQTNTEEVFSLENGSECTFTGADFETYSYTQCTLDDGLYLNMQMGYTNLDAPYPRLHASSAALAHRYLVLDAFESLLDDPTQLTEPVPAGA